MRASTRPGPLTRFLYPMKVDFLTKEYLDGRGWAVNSLGL